jgi:hypothetical protein
MSWLLARYLPVSLFALRPANVTASGGRSLITPTAFAIKMAILSASIQTEGVVVGESRFSTIRDLQIALALPEEIVLIKSFAKVLRETEYKGKSEEKAAWLEEQYERNRYPFGATIAYRELVQFNKPLTMAITTPQGTIPDWLPDTLLSINYLGRRGSFLQPVSLPTQVESLPSEYIPITRNSIDGDGFPLQGTLLMLDDCGPTMTFAHANIYDSKRITLGKERVLRHVVLPYQLKRSSRGYSLYQRISQEANP